MYDSRREAEQAQDYDLMRRAHLLKDWNNQIRISFDVTHDGRLVARSKNVYLPPIDNDVRIAAHLCFHDVDFLLVHPDDSLELVEMKSEPTKTSTWKLKLALLQASLLREHPEIKYSIVT